MEEMEQEEQFDEGEGEMETGEGGTEGEVSVITALKWIPRIHCLTKPIPYELGPEELEKLQAAGPSEQDEDQLEEEEVDLPLSQLEDLQLNAERLEEDDPDDEESNLGSDVEDHNLKPNDKLLLTASVMEDIASLEVHVYDTDAGSFYLHHDIALPSYPLCIEWIGAPGKQYGWTKTESESYVAVGTFSPIIEIWSLDVLDALEPNTKLEGHSDAVMCLAWNESHPHLLASGGSDNTVRLWDLQQSTCAKVFDKIHKDKVQSCAWNPAEKSVLLTGSFDKRVCVFDARDDASVSKYSLSGNSDIECVVWDIHNPALFGVSTENGQVSFFDVRFGPSRAPLFTFQAHEKACSTICGNYAVPGLYSTCSSDRTLKMWDLSKELSGSAEPLAKSKKKPALKNIEPICEKKMKVGKLFSCHFLANVGDVEDPFLIACGGSRGQIALWHAGTDEEDDGDVKFKNTFVNRVLPSPKKW